MYSFTTLVDKWKSFLIWSIEDDSIAFEVNGNREEILKQLEVDLMAGNATININGRQRKVHLWGRIHGNQFLVTVSRFLAWHFCPGRMFGSTEFSDKYLLGRLCFTPLIRIIAIVWMIVAVMFFVVATVLAVSIPFIEDDLTTEKLIAMIGLPAAGLGVLIAFRMFFRIFAVLGLFHEKHTVAYINQLLSP
ncbi:MAG: hypothetical protein ABJM26_19130 [Anderseniella sp.]